ncbi:MAG: YicC/YloC family endoribonuclease [Candidatus Neomarinimicrobiota bacterium]
MISSMTGFGEASQIVNEITVSVEVRSLNSRFLDPRFRLPKQIESLEEKINKKVREHCKRGRITVLISLEQSNNKVNNKLELDEIRFEKYKNLIENINSQYNYNLQLTDLVDVRDLLVSQQSTDLPDVEVLSVLDEALYRLNDMRTIEGKALAVDINFRIKNMKNILGKIRRTTEKTSLKLKDQYQEKIRSMMEGTSIDDSKIVMEAVVLAEKADVTEECVRCESHLDQIADLVSSHDVVGKRLNFLLQEILREINTIGSKSPDLNTINNVVDLKEETEKVKEQVQNIL